MLSIFLPAQYKYSVIKFSLSLHSNNLYILLFFFHICIVSNLEFFHIKRQQKEISLCTLDRCRVKTSSCILRRTHPPWFSTGWNSSSEPVNRGSLLGQWEETGKSRIRLLWPLSAKGKCCK